MIATSDLLDWVKADEADTVLLRRLEQAAVRYCEAVTGRYLGPEAEITEVVRWSGWPLSLRNEPVGGVITTLEKWDGSGWVTEVPSDYYVGGGFIYSNEYPPAERTRFQVTYQAGYPPHETDPDVWFAPEDVQQAVRLLVGHWHENREAVGVATTSIEIQLGVQALLSNHARVTV